MHPDDERDWQAAFTELHRREREQAPPFVAMRQRALSQTGRRPLFTFSLLRWAPAAVCVAVALLAWMARKPAPSKNSAKHVEQLLTSIQQQLELHETLSFSSYPTDALLTQNQLDPLP